MTVDPIVSVAIFLFGLALGSYAHFTSPIRRYSDMVVHRSLVRSYGFGEGGGRVRTQKEVAELAGIAWITVLRDERRVKGVLREALATVGTGRCGQEVAL